LGLAHGVAVRKTSRHWIVHVECLYGRSPGELFGLAKNLGDRVSQALMSKYAVLLGEGQVGKGYELAIDDPVAKLLSGYFTVSTPKRKMDHSPGELEGEIFGLSRQVADLRSDVSQLVQVLKEAITPKENHSVPLKDERYIS